MKRTKTVGYLVGACTLLALAAAGTSARAQHEHHGESQEQPAPQPEMSAEQKAAMAAYERAATPGLQHQELAAMAGSWTFTGSSWMAPSAPPETFSGSEERTLALGGRVLVSSVKSEFQGQPFEGQGMTGYDNVSGEWWGTWIDSMGTGLMLSTGSCAEHRCEFVGSYNDPLTKTKQSMRMVSTHEADREVHVMYGKAPDGTEFKSMEFVYTRKR